MANQNQAFNSVEEEAVVVDLSRSSCENPNLWGILYSSAPWIGEVRNKFLLFAQAIAFLHIILGWQTIM